MRALVFKHYGGPDQVAFADVPRPVPKPDEILVQVHAAGLNPIDNKIRDGKMKAIFGLRTGALAELAVVPENAAALKPAPSGLRASGLDPDGRTDGVASAQGAC